jgi:sugar phosphate isomerase/epimerase
MSLSPLPLGYCTNVHPAQTVAGVLEGLDRYTVPVMKRVGKPVAAGLWLAKPVAEELLASQGVSRFADALKSRGLTTYTLNAFPYGDFHAARVKENVYLPDWTTHERQSYTENCAQILAQLLAPELEGSISTLPIGFKGFDKLADLNVASERLTDFALQMSRLEKETGRTIRLAIEPEPFCLIETTDEAIAFFKLLWKVATRRGAEESVRRHIGVCYDVCHQAIEFEEADEAIALLTLEGIRINKVQISCAIHLDRPGKNPEARAALRHYIEPRYLHQTYALTSDDTVFPVMDLSESFLANPGDDFLAATAWRVHFHVPVDADHLGPLGTTRPAVRSALAALAKLDYAPHLEVETYTWNVMPGSTPPNLVEGLTNELQATQLLIREASE